MGAGHKPGTVLKPLVKLGKSPEDCWTWLGATTPDGDAKKTWFGQTLIARRWLYSLLFGPIPDGLVLSMKCGNKGCVNPHHMDRPQKFAKVAQRSVSSKLVPEDLIEIRTSKDSAPVVAARLGVSSTIVKQARRGETWNAARAKGHRTAPIPMPDEEAA